MIKLLKFIWFGCSGCRWETIKESRLTNEFDAIGTRYVLKCEKCGNVKKKDLI